MGVTVAQRIEPAQGKKATPWRVGLVGVLEPKRGKSLSTWGSGPEEMPERERVEEGIPCMCGGPGGELGAAVGNWLPNW